MDTVLKSKWVAALRSGEYAQGIGRLRNYKNEFCCLGVLCDMVNSDEWEPGFLGDYFIYNQESYILPVYLRDKIGIDSEKQGELIEMNDAKKNSFLEIADYIETSL